VHPSKAFLYTAELIDRSATRAKGVIVESIRLDWSHAQEKGEGRPKAAAGISMLLRKPGW
jgi:hypothetical protein